MSSITTPAVPSTPSAHAAISLYCSRGGTSCSVARILSTLSLREVTREAGIAPNSFYRQFRDMDELAVALIDLSGRSLRKIIGQARKRATTERSVVRGSLETFMEQLRADDKLLHVLLREGTVGSDAFKQAVDRELNFFEEELQIDLVRLAAADNARCTNGAGGQGDNAWSSPPGPSRNAAEKDPSCQLFGDAAHDHPARGHVQSCKLTTHLLEGMTK